MKVFEVGALDGLRSWKMAERPVPAPGPGQVLIRMRAASLNYRDILIVERRYGPFAPPATLIPVSDGAGDIVAIGPGVEKWRMGDRVTGIFSQGWQRGAQPANVSATTLGGGVDGVLAEYVVLPENGVVALPDHLSYAEGSTLAIAALTAWNALYGLKPLQPGQTVLTLGTGGVSIFAIQLAHAAGARVIATSSSDVKLERARALGADVLINYKTTPEWQDAVREATGGLGVDHVIEVGGAGTLQRSVASAAVGGVVTVIGLLSQAEPFDPMHILYGSVILRGIMVGSGEMFEAMNRAITQIGLRPVIDRTFPFARSVEALEYLAKGDHVGKVVIEFN